MKTYKKYALMLLLSGSCGLQALDIAEPEVGTLEHAEQYPHMYRSNGTDQGLELDPEYDTQEKRAAMLAAENAAAKAAALEAARRDYVTFLRKEEARLLADKLNGGLTSNGTDYDEDQEEGRQEFLRRQQAEKIKAMSARNFTNKLQAAKLTEGDHALDAYRILNFERDYFKNNPSHYDDDDSVDSGFVGGPSYVLKPKYKESYQSALEEFKKKSLGLR